MSLWKIFFHYELLTIYNSKYKTIQRKQKSKLYKTSFDWKALWTSFDDIECSKTIDSQVYDLRFNKSTRMGECGLSNDGTHINFPFFWYGTIWDQDSSDDNVIYVAKIPLPKVINKMFFKKIAKLVKLTYKELNNSGETIKLNYDWDTYSFQDNILEPNINHIQSVMGLSDDMTEWVVRASNYVNND